tara:strand:- start:49 stop:621 length:573 start_codon:yes stop_codon:yes gene_type:complete
MRLLGEYMLGADSPITAKDFKPEELAFIRQQITQQRQQNMMREQQLKDKADFLRRQSQATSGVKLVNPEEALQEALSDLGTYDKTRGATTITDPYKGTREVVDQGYFPSLVKSFTDPQYNVATSLGKYVAKEDDGGLRIEDTYDFNPKERKLPGGLAALRNVTNSPEVLFEYLANMIERDPRPVDLYLED